MNIAVRSNHVLVHEAVKSRCRPINVPRTANVVCGYRLRVPRKVVSTPNQFDRTGFKNSGQVHDDAYGDGPKKNFYRKSLGNNSKMLPNGIINKIIFEN